MPNLTTTTELSLPLEIWFDYYPSERPSRDDPGSPASIEITNVFLLSAPRLELTDRLPAATFEYLEYLCWDHLQELEDSAIVDRALDSEDCYLEPISGRDYDIS